MRLSVHHATRFDFDQPSGHSIHDVRLTPKPAAGQRIVSWRIDGPGKRSDWLDGHGNEVTTFSVAQQHDHVEIVVHGVYEYSGSEQWLRYAEVPTLPAPFWPRASAAIRPTRNCPVRRSRSLAIGCRPWRSPSAISEASWVRPGRSGLPGLA